MPRFLNPRGAISLPLMVVGLAVVAGGAPERDLPAPAPPEAAASDSFYPHKSVKRRELGFGAKSYWLFEPAEPAPERAPVVVFHHGWLAMNPGAYGAWIEHLVRSGSIVVFPRYQDGWTTRPADFLLNSLDAVRDAFDVLQTAPGHVRPDRERFALI